nr:hypothetical protein [Tanacetum cinerariifolium]
MPEAVREAVQTQTNRLQDSIQRENDEFLKTIDKNMKKIIKEQVKTQVKAQVTRILPRIEEAVNAQLEAEVLTRSSHSSRTSYAIAADLSEMELKKILIDKIEGNKREDDDQEGPSAGSNRGSKRQREGGEHASASTPSEPATESVGRSTTGSQSRQLSASAEDQPIIQTTQHPEWFSQPSRPPTPDRDWNKSMPAAQGNAQSWISALTKQTDARSSFKLEELLTELEYHLEEVYKASTDQLDWVNPKGQQYPHNLLQPLPLIPDNRGRRDHYSHRTQDCGMAQLQASRLDIGKLSNLTVEERFAFNVSLRMFTRSIVIQRCVEDLQLGVESYQKRLNLTKPDTYRSDLKRREALNVDTLTLELLAGPTYELMRGSCTSLTKLEYHLEEVYKATTDQLDWVNPEVTELKIVEWHNYKHLDWISVRHDDDKIYKFKEGDLKRLRIQDIEDMLLLLVQGKLSKLTVEERFAFNVSLRMFTRSIVIQRSVEDLQLGVESYQKRLNLTKPDTYQSDLKRREAYTAHSNPRGFIYQNNDKKNRLMQIDELHKFSDGTLNDVRNALDDRLKGIRMQYLPTTIWRKGDKDRAAAIIQAIDKMLKTRRIMRSLEMFVGGRQYEGDFRLLQRTI